MTTLTEKRPICTATVTPNRVQLYQPTQRPVAKKAVWTETAWGRCKVTGRIGQRHADLMDALLFCAEKRKDEESGQIKLLVDPAKVRQTLSDDNYSFQQIWVLIEELSVQGLGSNAPPTLWFASVYQAFGFRKLSRT